MKIAYLLIATTLVMTYALRLSHRPETPDEALMVNGSLILPLDGDGKFVFDPSIKHVFLDIGVMDVTDFVKEISEDASLLVIGIDANPHTLTWQKFKHPRFKLFNFAAGSQDSITLFHVTKNPGCSSVLQPNTQNFDGDHLPDWVKAQCLQTAETINVTMRRLDSFLDRIPMDIPIDFLKTDVQGYDFEVLKSAGDALKRVQKVQYEIQDNVEGSSHNLYDGIPLRETVDQFVASKGFPTPLCTTANKIQEIIRELDCVACRANLDSPEAKCTRKG